MNLFAINSAKNCCKKNNSLTSKFKVNKQLLLIMTFLFFGTFLTFGQTFPGTTGAIDDDNCPITNDFTATVAGVGVLGTTNFFNEVVINISHTYDDDLEITLIAPSGVATVLLSSGNGGSGNDFTDTHFRLDATTNIASGSPPFTGNFLPDGDLTDFDGINADGTWILQICDSAGQDIGTVDSWEVTFGTEAVEPFDCTNPINPAPDCNAFDIIVVLDESGSIDNGSNGATQVQQVKDATLNLVQVLIGTGARIAIVEFAANSSITSLPSYPAGYHTVTQAYYDELAAYIPTNYVPSGNTNWEAALDDVLTLNNSIEADILLFLTDGNPTTSVSGGNDLTAALDESCEIKQDGTHIFMLGVGTGIDEANLQAISGPIEDDGPANPALTPLTADWANADFSEIQQCFQDIVQGGCTPNLELSKTVYLGHDSGASCPGSETVANTVSGNVTYCFTVENQGQQTLTDLTFNDPDLAALLGVTITEADLTGWDTTLDPGESQSYYLEVTLPGNTSFPFINEAEVEGKDPGDQLISDKDTAEVTAPLCNPTADCNNLADVPVESCNATIPTNYDAGNTDGELADVFSNVETCGTAGIRHEDSNPGDICSGTTITRTYYLTDDGQDVQGVTCTRDFVFTVPELTLSGSCPGDPQLTGCATSSEIDLAWTNWINGLNAISASGGCNAITEYSTPINQLVKPTTCGNSAQVVSISINAKDDCGETSSIECTFTVGEYINNIIISDCPSDPNLDGCSSDSEIDTAWNNWISGIQAMTANGSCGAINVDITPALNTLVKPTKCGLSEQQVTVSIGASDLCGQAGTQCTFTVGAYSNDLTLSEKPTDVITSACVNPADEFAAWIQALENMSASGGCNAEVEYSLELNTLSVNGYCNTTAQVVSVDINAKDDCGETQPVTAMFTVPAYSNDLQLVGSCPTANEVDGCSTDAEISLAFNAWKTAILTNFSATGGCNAEVEYSTDVANLQVPTECGSVDQVISVDVKATDDCGETSVTKCTFTVSAFESTLALDEVEDESYPSCNYETQDALNIAFQTFLDKFGYSGGCDASEQFASAYSAPDLCAGGTVNVTYTVTDLCETKDELASFEIVPSDQLDVSCPSGVILGSSLTAQEISDAYDLWVADFSYTGGCNVSDNLDELPDLPNYDCGTGVDISFDYIATDRCNPNGITCSSTFFVPGVTGLTVDCPAGVELPACTSQADIITAYNAWRDGFAVNDGDNPTSNIGDIPLLPDFVCGEDIDLEFELTANDACNVNGVSCTSYFRLAAPEPLMLIGHCDFINDLDGCSTSVEIALAFGNWKTGLLANFDAIGGCSAEVEYSTDVANLPTPTICGTQDQVISVFINAKDDCGETQPIECTFTVRAFESTLALDEVEDESYPSCNYETQTELDSAFQAFLDKFGYSGGCDASGQFASAYSAPDLCAGGTVNVTYTVTDLCETKDELASFEIVPSDQLDVSCPSGVILGSSSTQQEIEDAFAAWKFEFANSGGCDASDNLASFPSLPAFDCGTGVDISFDYIATDRCNPNGVTCSSTFFVPGITGLTVDCPAGVELPACTSQADIITAYNAWRDGFAVNDGDNPTSNIGDIPLLPDFVCGEDIDLEFELIANDACNPNGVSCVSAFKVGAAEDLVLVGSCSTTNEVDGCSTNTEISLAFDTWKTAILTNFSAAGGCNAEVEYSIDVANLQAPTQCGTQDQVISVFINAKDDCGETQPIECTFTVRAFESTLALDEVEDESYPSCNYETQTELDSAFQAFLDKFGYSGGCDASGQFASAYSAPDLCAGGTVNVTYTVTDLCETKDELASFEIVPSDQLDVSCPSGVILGSSLTAQEISDAYDLWVADFSYTGGCNASDNLNLIPDLPNYDCGTGVDISFAYIATDRCNPNGVTCSSTFFVPGVTGLTVDCPTAVNLGSCTSEADIITAYNAWRDGFGVNNGDNPSSNIGDIPVLPDYACGGEIDLSFTLTAIDACNSNGVSCTSTFKVGAAEDLVLVGSCPTANEVDGCSTNAEISLAFDAWKTAMLTNFSATGGCNAAVEYSADVANLQAPTQCGTVDQVISIDVKAIDDCGETSVTKCSFTVRAFSSTLDVTDVIDESYASCDYASQDELNSDFQAFLDKFGYTGGCDASGQLASAYSAPDLCAGGTVEVTYNVTDLCENDSETASFTITPSALLEVSCPTAVNLDASSTQQEIQDAYDAWKLDFTMSGGCNASDNLDAFPSLPNSLCDTSIDLSFNYVVTDRCHPNGVSCSSIFNVEGQESVDAGENGELTICENGTVTAEELFEALGGDPNEGGSWSPELGGANVYTYTVQGSEFCPDAMATVTVEELLLDISASEPVCDEEIGTYSVNVQVSEGMVSSTLGTPVDNGGGSWTITDIPNDNNIVVTTTSTVSNDVNCTKSVNIIAPDCICIELELDYTDVTCFGLDDGTITVNYVTEGATVTVNGELYDANMLYVPGTYTVVAYFEGNDDEDCIITEDITIYEPAFVDVQVSSTDVTCFGADDGTITIESLSEGAFYTIKQNGFGPDLSGQDYFSPGTYVVVASLIDPSARMSASDDKLTALRSQNPCVDGKLVVIEEPEQMMCRIGKSYSGNEIRCNDRTNNNLFVDVFGGVGPYTYSWSMNKYGYMGAWHMESGVDEQTMTYIPGLGNATFFVEITDANGCKTTCQISLESTCTKADYYNSLFRKSGFDFDMYPNPTKGNLTIIPNKLSGDSAVVELYDLIGTRILHQTINKITNNEFDINLSGLSSQVYYLKVTTKDGTKIKKVVLDK